MTPAPTPAEWLADALGNPPFPWQARLLARFRAGDPPRQLDIPTGLGKTAVMAAWLVARALGAPFQALSTDRSNQRGRSREVPMNHCPSDQRMHRAFAVVDNEILAKHGTRG